MVREVSLGIDVDQARLASPALRQLGEVPVALHQYDGLRGQRPCRNLEAWGKNSGPYRVEALWTRRKREPGEWLPGEHPA